MIEFKFDKSYIETALIQMHRDPAIYNIDMLFIRLDTIALELSAMKGKGIMQQLTIMSTELKKQLTSIIESRV